MKDVVLAVATITMFGVVWTLLKRADRFLRKYLKPYTDQTPEQVDRHRHRKN